MLAAAVSREKVWRNLLDYVGDQEYFLPAVVRQRLNPDAEEIFDDFLDLMKSHKMIISFQRSRFSHKLAFWFLWMKFKILRRRGSLPEVFVKGPGWEHWSRLSFDELKGVDLTPN